MTFHFGFVVGLLIGLAIGNSIVALGVALGLGLRRELNLHRRATTMIDLTGIERKERSS